jgi:DNA-binding CsgD family transcriptional regulator
LQAVISKNEAFGSLRRELNELVVGEAEQEKPPNRAAMPLSLTAREAKIFNLIGRGLSTKAIAEQLALSRHTVQTHRKRIAIKLGTTGNELTRRAVAHRVEFFEDSAARCGPAG